MLLEDGTYLNTGEVPNLFVQEDLSSLHLLGPQPTRGSHLHHGGDVQVLILVAEPMVCEITMSPIGDAFRDLRMFLP